jgi:imidazolonepropionase-like amidohydrolase
VHDRDLGRAQRRNFTKAVRAGVKMTFGTDAGVCAHGTNGRQFAVMVEYGMTPGVQGDPLTDVRVLERVAFVMKKGVVYKYER